MPYNYDRLYRDNPHALGEPAKAFVDFFANYETPDVRVLDVGCGQGRDALFIARLGHRVVGVDMAPAGIADLVAEAKQEGLSVRGDVADIITYTPDGLFDIILIDRTLHMLAEADRHAVLARLITHLTLDGTLLIADDKSNIPSLSQVIAASGHDWDVINDKRGYLFMRRTG